MPFQETTRMELRKQMVLCLRNGDITVSEAAKRYGVTRKTVRKWRERAEVCPLETLTEASRAPVNKPGKTSQGVESRLLELKEQFPHWGAKKLVRLLADEGIQLPVRTGDRILSRHGKVQARGVLSEPQRFEREASNMLYQMDFKGLPRSTPYSLLSVIDDASRMCLVFDPLPDRTGTSVFERLWEMFGEFGLPECFLMDNGDCWGTSLRRCPTAFEAKLWRLGIRTTHGRPNHPQTQGKVERFHRTAKLEMGASLVQSDWSAVRRDCKAFKDRYNWVRPHEAIDHKVPGRVFVPSCKKRPDYLPEAILLPGLATRKVDAAGRFSFKGNDYKIGRGLCGQPIQLREEDMGTMIYYAGMQMLHLHQLKMDTI
jgi:transposase InsO family protein